jgi:hypothetical protein
MEAIKVRRALNEVFWAMNESNFSPKILIPAKLSFKIDGALKILINRN